MPLVKVEGLQPRDNEKEPILRHPVLITGGAGATGRVIAERFRLEGFPVVIGTRSESKFNELRNQFVSKGCNFFERGFCSLFYLSFLGNLFCFYRLIKFCIPGPVPFEFPGYCSCISSNPSSNLTKRTPSLYRAYISTRSGRVNWLNVYALFIGAFYTNVAFRFRTHVTR